MNLIFIAVLLLSLAQAPGGADIPAGKLLWENTKNDVYCLQCHGRQGQGGFAPDLAGHGLTARQFMRAVRQPWGIMPAFTAKSLSDQDLTNMAAYLASLPKVEQPAAWTNPAPNGTPRQKLAMAAGCGQCHGAVLATPRKFAGGEGADFEWFKRAVYEHSDFISGKPMVGPRIRMGNYSKDRFPDFYMREIWQFFAVEAGLRAPFEAEIKAAPATDRGVTYSVTFGNMGEKGHGLAAEDITITLPLPPGTQVVTTTGAGYQGIRRDEKNNADAAVWKVARMAAADQQTITLTLSGTGAGAGIAKGNVVWAKPPLDSAKGTPDESPVRQAPKDGDGILRQRDVAGNPYIFIAP
jgi:mono/diheme cytochrome c family protein